MKALGGAARGPGAVYFTGGASAVLIGWRATTVDVDLRLDPEPPGVFESMPRIKDELSINIELASPSDFIPEVEGWPQRSLFIRRVGQVDFFHYDFLAQALAKIERGHERDLDDVRSMIARGLVSPSAIADAFEGITGRLHRYPAIDADVFREKVERFLGSEAPHGR